MIYTSDDYERMTNDEIRKEAESKLSELIARASQRPPQEFIGAVLTGYAQAWEQAAEKQIEANTESGWSAEIASNEAAAMRETIRTIFRI